MAGTVVVISGAELTTKNQRLQIDLEHRLNRWFQETANKVGEAIKRKYNPRVKKIKHCEILTTNVAKQDPDPDPEGDDLQTELLVGGKKIPKIQSDLIRALALLGWGAINWTELANIMQPYLEDAANEGVNVGVGQVQFTDAGKVMEQARSDARDYASIRSAELAGMKRDAAGNLEPDADMRWPLTTVMRGDLDQSITQAVVEGWTASQLAAVIEASYALSSERAEIIANTELTNAQSAGTYSLWRRSGSITLVQWVTSPDHELDDECDDYEAQGVVPLGHEFDVGLFAPRAHPFCRCSLEVVTPNAALL